MQPSDFSLLAVVKILAIAYAVICLFMWALQRQLIYRPHTDIQAPESYGLREFTELGIDSDDGLRLQGWYHAARTAYPTIVYFQGNAGHLGGRAGFYQSLADAGFGVLALSYRGYGHSGGKPTEQGLYKDARAIINYAVKQLSLRSQQLILYGESLGTGVAVQLALEYPVAALVLQSPFTSISDLAKHNYPWIPVDLLLVDRFDSLVKISNLSVPLLVFHGENDPVVPIRYGKALFEQAPLPKQAVYLPGRGHNDLDPKLLTDLTLAFSNKYKLIGAK